MEIIPTFDGAVDLWCVVYPEDKVDILTVLFEKWTDTEYLLEFFVKNINDLNGTSWQGISIDEAIKLVIDEVYYLQEKLICINNKLPECWNLTVRDIFTTLNKQEFMLRKHEERFRKGKIDSLPQMLRLYAIELEDNTIILTGGTIKLTDKMDRPHFDIEFTRLVRVNDYLKSELIYSKEGLL